MSESFFTLLPHQKGGRKEGGGKMGVVGVKMEVHGKNGMVELSKTFESDGVSVGRLDDRVILRFSESLSVNLDERTFKDMLILGVHIVATPEEGIAFDTLEKYCEWTGKDVFEFVMEAVFEKLRVECEQIASYDIPKAKEFAERLKEVSIS